MLCPHGGPVLPLGHWDHLGVCAGGRWCVGQLCGAVLAALCAALTRMLCLCLLAAAGPQGQPAALAWEEQSPEPVPATTERAFLSLCDKLVYQQQEVMLVPSSVKGNSSWFPWGH